MTISMRREKGRSPVHIQQLDRLSSINNKTTQRRLAGRSRSITNQLQLLTRVRVCEICILPTVPSSN